MNKLLILASLFMSACAHAAPQVPADSVTASDPYQWSRSLPVDFQSSGIGSLGGTEARALVPFDGKLFAGIGYWRDTQSEDPKIPGAQVLSLDAPLGNWKVDLELSERVPAGRNAGQRRFQAIGALSAFQAHQDASGRTLAQPVSFLMASVWDRVGGLRLFARGVGASAAWNSTDLATGVPPSSQVRSFGTHVDAITQRELFFAGASPGGVYAGTFDGGVPYFIRWNASPETWGSSAGALNQARVMSFAECNGKLYASSGFELFERRDGANPFWKKIYTFESPSRNPHFSGFRGLKTIAAIGGGEQLLIAVENNPVTIIRVDPRLADSPGGVHGVLELDLSAYLAQIWNTKVGYGIAAYNDMTSVKLPGTACSSILIGFQVTTPRDPAAVGLNHKHPWAQYLVRRCDAFDSRNQSAYEVHQIYDPARANLPLVSTRTLVASPFAQDPPGTIYAAGLDAGNLTVHNSAWIYRGLPAK